MIVLIFRRRFVLPAVVLGICVIIMILFTGCEKQNSNVSKDETKALKIAFSQTLDSVENSALNDFRKDHPDIAIEFLDYSEYNTPLEPNAGEYKLAVDLFNGLCKPDLIIGEAKSDLMKQIAEKGLYRDLTPFLNGESKVNMNDLFASIRASYTAKNGEMWGLGDVFIADTIIGNNALIGELTSKESWTIADLLDLRDSLPDDVYLAGNLWQSNADDMLLGQDVAGQFIHFEDMTCSFDDPIFIRWLNYLASLPKTYEQLKAISPLDDAPSVERYAFYHQNRVALSTVYFWNLQFFTNLKASFGTDDYTFLGFADGKKNPIRIDLERTYVMGAGAEQPELVCELIESFFITDPSGVNRIHGIPSLKSVFHMMAEEYEKTDIITYFSGGGGSLIHDDEEPFAEADLKEPGIITRFTAEDADRIIAVLDNPEYPSLLDRTPDEVEAIIEEEISVFLNRDSITAEQCAKNIQSRVSIWLTEHRD